MRLADKLRIEIKDDWKETKEKVLNLLSSYFEHNKNRENLIINYDTKECIEYTEESRYCKESWYLCIKYSDKERFLNLLSQEGFVVTENLISLY